MPTRSDPARPGPVGDGDRLDVGPATPAAAQASSRTGTIQRRWARAATSGTIPPVAACIATWLATTLAWMRRPSSTSGDPGLVAADVSTARSSGPLTRSRHPVAAPRRRRLLRRRSATGAASSAARSRSIRSRIAASVERLGGHDQRVLVVVAVVARPEPDRPEAVLLVQPAGRAGSRGGPRASPRGRRGRTARSSSASSSRSPMRRRRQAGWTAKVVMWASSTISHIPA